MALFDIYGLYDPTNGELRYIGKANCAAKRLKSHLRDSKKRNTPVYVWIRELASLGLIPVCKVILQTENWQADEVALIEQHKLAGANLLNVAIGGNEPFCSKAVRAANGAKNAADIHSDPKRKRLWYLKKRLAESFRFFNANGMQNVTERIQGRLLIRGVQI